MTTKITWDEAAANAETASVPQKLLNTVVPLYNKLIDIENKINAASDVDAAVAVYLESPDLDEETLTLKKQIEQAKSLIAKHTATLEEKARAAVVDASFDEAKAKAAHNDTRNMLKDHVKSILGTFQILGYVQGKTTETGRVVDLKGTTPEGELLLKINDVPKLGKGESAGRAVNEEVVAFNKAAKQWGKDNGWEVADKGALSKAVKEAYSAASGVPIPA